MKTGLVVTLVNRISEVRELHLQSRDKFLDMGPVKWLIFKQLRRQKRAII